MHNKMTNYRNFPTQTKDFSAAPNLILKLICYVIECYFIYKHKNAYYILN